MMCMAMVVVLSTTLAGCRGCTSADDEVRWIPTPSGVADQGEYFPEEPSDSIDVIVDEAPEMVASTRKSTAVSGGQGKARAKRQPTVARYCDTTDDSCIRLEEYTRDPIQLTIVFPDIEIQITKGHSEEE